MVNQAFIIVIAYRPRRRKIPGIGRYPMGPTMMKDEDGDDDDDNEKTRIRGWHNWFPR